MLPLRGIGSSSSSSHHNGGSSESICDAFTAAAAAVAQEEEQQQQQQQEHEVSYNCLAEQAAALGTAAAAAAADPLTPRSCLRGSSTEAVRGPAADDLCAPGSPTAAADKAAAAAAAADVSVGSQKRVRFTVERPAGTTPSRDYSLLYAAPELLSGQRPTEKVDVFAFGVLLYELLSRGLLISHCAAAVGDNRSRRSRHGSSGGSRHGGRHSPPANPPHTPSAASDASGPAASPGSHSALPEQQLLLTYAQMVAGGYRPPFPAHFPAPVADLISSCWAAEPHERPRMSDVLAQLQAWSQDKQLVGCLDSYLAGLADLGYGPGNTMRPSCGCSCVIC
ncbi:kinase-like domain-containing protein [Scenedesmus sp. NREL 46B-D3]|nr:kinase-like domain-containing protein [Scenedesmus sp. NREL 46B-D3]